MSGLETDWVGRNLGPYRIIEQIGRGGMAIVYKAYEPALDRYVAIKVLPQYFAHDPDFAARFEREAKAVAKLNHPNILPIYGYGQEDGLSYIVMRYVEAGTLKEILGRPLHLQTTTHILGQVGRALDYAHQRGIIHRDVKPSNVLMAEGSWALLTDFGVARIIESSTQITKSGVRMGTPAYMSPEQGQGLKVDARSDVYSLGVVLYEMVTGKVPFDAETPMAVVIQHMTAPLPLPRQANPNIPPAVERVVLKALAKEPNDRFQSAREMAEALEAAVAATTTPEMPTTPSDTDAPAVKASKPTPPPVQPRAEPRSRTGRELPIWLLGAAAVMALLIVVAGVILLMQGGEPSSDTQATDALAAPRTSLPETENTSGPAEEESASMQTGEKHVEEGWRLLDEGDPEAAIEQFDEALNLDPENPDAYGGRAAAYLALDRPDMTVADATRAIELDPEKPVFWADRAWAYKLLGDYGAAISDFDRAIELEPGDPWYYRNRAEVYTELDDPYNALADYDAAIELDAEDPWAFVERSWVYRSIGEHGRALDDLNEAIRIDPHDPFIYIERASFYEEDLGDEGKAVDDLNAAVDVAPEYAEPYYYRAEYYQRRGDWEAAISDLTQAIRLAPDWPDLYGHRGEAYLELGLVDEAREDFETFLEMTEGDPDYEDWRAWIEDWLAQQ